MLTIIVNCVENVAQFWNAMFWNGDLDAIRLDLICPRIVVSSIGVINSHLRLRHSELDRLADTFKPLKLIVMLGIWHRSIRNNYYVWSIIISIHSVRTCIYTTTHVLYVIFLTLNSCIVLGTIHSLCIIISSWAHLAITRLAGITLASLIRCSASCLPVTTSAKCQMVRKS